MVSISLPPADPRLTETDQTIDNGKTTSRILTYDASNNVTDTYEYNYGDTTGSQGLLARHTNTTYQTSTAYTSPPVHLTALPLSQSVDSGGAAVSQTQYCYDEPSPATGVCATAGSSRGNATRVRRWRNTDSAYLDTTTVYDANGNPTTVQNPRGFQTSLTYTCSNSFVHQVTNPLSQQTTYDYMVLLSTTRTVAWTSRQESLTRMAYRPPLSYADSLNRLIQVVRAPGITGLENQTIYTYPDLVTVSSQRDQYRKNDPNGIQSTSITDLP